MLRCRVTGALRAFILLACLSALAGCSPSRFLANRIVKAPNSYPTWFAPEPRVYLGYQPRVTDRIEIESMIALWNHRFTNGLAILPPRFPATNLHAVPPELGRRFTSDPARLAFRVVPPAAYNLVVRATNWSENGHEKAEFDFKRTIPALPIPGLSQPQGTVVLLHGYGLDHESMLPWAFWFGERGWQSILVDLRGHGRSTGRRISFGPIETLELQAFLDHLIAQGRAPSPILTLGVSYGATVALRWAGTDPRIDSAIAIAPYARLGDAMENIRADFAPWIPASWTRSSLRKMPDVLGVPASELDPVTVLQANPPRALLLAGGADVIAPVAAVESLQDVCRRGSRLWVLDGSNHEALPFRFNQLAPPIERWTGERLLAQGKEPLAPANTRPGTALHQKTEAGMPADSRTRRAIELSSERVAWPQRPDAAMRLAE